MNRDKKPKRPVFKNDEEGQYAEYLYLKGEGKISAHKAKTEARIKTLNDASEKAMADYSPAWLQALQVRSGQVGNKPSEASNT